ncbi:MAG: ATPase, T2SS/T4P/T4SS family [Clostridiales bacterium]
MNDNNDKRLEDILVDAGLLTNDRLEEIKGAQEKTGQNIQELLLSEEPTNNKEKMHAKARRMGVEYVDLETIPVNRNAILKVSSEVAKKYFVFPFDVSNNLLHLAMENPDDIFLIDEIKIFTQMEIKPFLADGRMISKAIDYFYNNTGEMDEDTGDFGGDLEGDEPTVVELEEDMIKEQEFFGEGEKESEAKLTKSKNKKEIDEEKQADQLRKLQEFRKTLNVSATPIKPQENAGLNKEIVNTPKNQVDSISSKKENSINEKVSFEKNNIQQNFSENTVESTEPEYISDFEEFIRKLIVKALYITASNVHIDETNEDIRVRYRVNGRLSKSDLRKGIDYNQLLNKIKEMAELNLDKKGIPQKGRMRYDMEEEGSLYITVVVLPTPSGEKLMLKFGSLRTPFTIDNIGFTQLESDRINTMLEKRSGMIVVSGTEESGKSSTINALIKKMLQEEVNVISVEEKIEELIEGISQLDMKDNPFDSSYEYIKLAIDNDPDVLVVDSEIDSDALKLLMNTALGGKLVIVSMGYSTVYETLEGFIKKDKFEDFMVAAAVNGIIAQRVIRKTCKDCRGKTNKSKSKDKSSNCKNCNNTGYAGYIGVFEVFNLDSDLKNILTKDNGLDLIKSRIKNDKSTFEENCVRLIVEEVTSIDEVIRLGFGNKLYDF